MRTPGVDRRTRAFERYPSSACDPGQITSLIPLNLDFLVCKGDNYAYHRVIVRISFHCKAPSPTQGTWKVLNKRWPSGASSASAAKFYLPFLFFLMTSILPYAKIFQDLPPSVSLISLLTLEVTLLCPGLPPFELHVHVRGCSESIIFLNPATLNIQTYLCWK